MKTQNKMLLSLATIMVLSVSAWGACLADVDMGGNNITMGAGKITTTATSFADDELVTKAYVNQGGDSVSGPNFYNTTYGVIYAGGKAWLDRNLGATEAPISVDDTNINTYGWLFQWGRSLDMHQERDSAAVANIIDSGPYPGHSYFITTTVDPNNWTTYYDDTYLWQSAYFGGYDNSVCPSGWSVPSINDFISLDLMYESDVYNKIKLNYAGRRLSDGVTHDEATELNKYAYYWTSTKDGEYSKALVFSTLGIAYKTVSRSVGLPVRCVKHIY